MSSTATSKRLAGNAAPLVSLSSVLLAALVLVVALLPSFGTALSSSLDASLASKLFVDNSHELDETRFQQYGRFRQRTLGRDDPAPPADPAAAPPPAAPADPAAPPAAPADPAAAPAPPGGAPPASAPAPVAAGGGSDECDVCTYVLENKESLQPYLCRGLRDPQQQMACVKVLMSLIWWMPNEVYWVNYGCQRQASGGQWTWTRPCPPHVICSWLKTLESGNEKPYCPASPQYRKPQ